MNPFEPFNAQDVDAIAKCVLVHGFALVRKPLTDAQFDLAHADAQRVVTEQTAAIPLDKANRGYARYSFGSQVEHPGWLQLVDLPTILPIMAAIWGSDEFTCSGAGGDYSLPGAEMQGLHSDIGEQIHDPVGGASIRDLPPPFIVVNFTMTRFDVVTGATRFVPGTQRSREPTPDLEHEPEEWKRRIVEGPPNTALVRDVRCWHGGTPNVSGAPRIMTSVGYVAPWFRLHDATPSLARSRYNELSPRAQQLCRFIVREG